MVTQSKDLVTVREAARECGRTTETVRRWIWDGKLPAQKLGNQLFINRADLRRMASAVKDGDAAQRMAVLDRATVLRERIRQRIGGSIDVLATLKGSREAHP
jgi:excisionase family DNA binding protein